MDVKHKRGTVVAHAQAAHPGPAIAVTLAAALLTRAAELPVGPSVLVAAAVLAGQLSIGWSNDLLDLERDRASQRADKPLATDLASASSVRAACAVAVLACLALSLACGIVPGLLHLLLVAAAWTYNLGLKSTVWSWLPYAVAFGGLPVFVSLVEGGDAFPWWVAAAGALLGVGAHFLNIVPDLADDAATGVRGLPHRWGAARSVVVAVALLASASLVVALGTAARGSRVTWGALGLVAALVVTTLVAHGRTPFRAAMGIALVDVALLAWVL